jgi:hypothetical protein
MVAKKDMPLLQHACAASPTASSTSSYCSRPRLASEELIVPASDTASSVYYGVDAFSPTLVDFYTADQKRIVWSSRAHRKMMTTLYRAWHGKCWKLFSLSFWGSLCAIFAYTLFLIGFVGEAMAHGSAGGSTASVSVHALVDIPLFVGAVCYFAWHIVSYFEVINSCHNLEIWLDEYFHGTEPVLERRFFGFFPTRIDFWSAVLGILGSSLYVFARAFIMLRADQKNFGVIDIQRDNLSLIVGYWLPFFAGSFLLLTSAYLTHVEVIHQWISCRLTTLETWVTGASADANLSLLLFPRLTLWCSILGLSLLAVSGFFAASTLQFMDPFSVLFSFETCMVPFGLGCLLGLSSSVLSIAELENIHKRHNHPEYGLWQAPAGYGTYK